ncbi:secretion/conjugation apparatus DotM-related subunit [Bosea sp. RAC05]|uniref:secretion/conjugation apparatus DotM-related subunit n=1 Tax=Bosea sp. RAC05 TaxID=1842539 RepID=UPI00083D73DA|nr:hypothetical protein [Bosea sp. RAC05]AOG03274.1 icmP domain protein [Bosea sp. RAC05]
MEIQIYPKQILAGFVGGLIATPAVHLILSQFISSDNWSTALVVGGLGIAAAAVAGNGDYEHSKAVVQSGAVKPDIHLNVSEFLDRHGSSGAGDLRNEMILRNAFSAQVRRPVSPALYESLMIAFHWAKTGNLAALDCLKGVYTTPSDGMDKVYMPGLTYFKYEFCPTTTTSLYGDLEVFHGSDVTRLIAAFVGSGLASCDLRWLKAVDRGLWYAITNVGRRVYFAEGAGPIAHYMAERAAGKAIRTPEVELAVLGAISAVSIHIENEEVSTHSRPASQSTNLDDG